MIYKTFIFDFDGTIADTLEVIFQVYNEIAPEFGCKIMNKEDFEVIRKKTPREFIEEIDVSYMKLPKMLLRGREELHKRIEDIHLVDNIEKQLIALKDAGFELGILTSNSKKNVKLFLEHKNLEHLFNFIYTSKHIFSKDKIMLKCIKKNKLEKSRVVYVGDETRDIEAAKKAGIPIIAVSWGFSKAEALRSLNPEYLIDSPKDLMKYAN